MLGFEIETPNTLPRLFTRAASFLFGLPDAYHFVVVARHALSGFVLSSQPCMLCGKNDLCNLVERKKAVGMEPNQQST